MGFEIRKYKNLIVGSVIVFCVGMGVSVAAEKDSIINLPQWIHYSNLETGTKMMDLYVYSGGFRILGDGVDCYGRLMSKSGNKHKYGLTSNLNKPVVLGGGVITEAEFSSSKVALTIIDKNSLKKGVDVLQEIDS